MAFRRPAGERERGVGPAGVHGGALSEDTYPIPDSVPERSFMGGRVKMGAKRVTPDTESCMVTNGEEIVA